MIIITARAHIDCHHAIVYKVTYSNTAMQNGILLQLSVRENIDTPYHKVKFATKVY